MGWQVIFNIAVLFFLASITACAVISTVILFRFARAVAITRDQVIAFVSSTDGKPSPLRQMVDLAWDSLARRLLAEARTSLGGMASANVRAQQKETKQAGQSWLMNILGGMIQRYIGGLNLGSMVSATGAPPPPGANGSGDANNLGGNE